MTYALQIYTDVIVFAPISSSFSSTAQKSKASTIASTAQAPSDSQSNLLDATKTGGSTETPTSRREWIRKWQQSHPGRPSPCSAKAVYRLADSESIIRLSFTSLTVTGMIELGLLELKERAYQVVHTYHANLTRTYAHGRYSTSRSRSLSRIFHTRCSLHSLRPSRTSARSK